MDGTLLSYSILLSMLIFINYRYLNVINRRKRLSIIIGHYNKHIEKLDLPVPVYSELTETFRIWDWSYEGMINDYEVREKIGNYIKGKKLEFTK